MVRRFLSPACSVLLASAIAFGVSSTAFAQPAAQPPQDISDEADRLFREGNEAFKAEKWQQAIALYEAAFAKKKTHDIATNLAYAEMKLGYFARAARYLAFAVKNSPPTGNAEKRRIAVERLAGLKAKLATLSIEVNVAGAQIFMDGKPVGTSPLTEELFADPGAVRIEAKREGYTPAQQVVQAEKGGEHSVKLTLVEALEKDRGPSVSSTTSGSPAAGSSTLSPEKSHIAPAGNGNAPGESKPTPSADQKGTPQDGTTHSGGPKRAILITGAVTAGVSLGAGITFAALAAKKAGEVDEAYAALDKLGDGSACRRGSFDAQCEALHNHRVQFDLFASLSVWTFVTAGVAGAATGIYAWKAPKAGPASHLQAVPVVTGKGGGFVIQGAW